MAKIFNSLRSFFKDKLEETVDKATYSSETSMPGPEEESAFISFLRQQAKWIKEHIEYETDMLNNLSTSDNILVKFNIDDYAANIIRYLNERGLYSCKLEHLFPIILNIIAPPEDIEKILSRENRKILFGEVLVSVSSKEKIELADLIKVCYNLISHNARSINGKTSDRLLDLFKDSVEYIEKKQRTEDNGEEIKSYGRMEEPFGAQMLITEILKGFSVNSRADLVKVFEKNSIFGLLISVIVQSALIVIGGTLLLVDNLSLDLANALGIEPEKFAVLLEIAVFVLAANIVLQFAKYIKNRARRKGIVNTLKTIIGFFNIPHSIIAVYFRSRFNYDIRKIK